SSPGAEAVVQLLIEAEVDVDVLVGRAVERADVGGRGPAAGGGRPGEEHRVGGTVGPPVGAEPARPVRLHAVDVGDDAAVLPLVRIRAGGAVELRRGAAAPGADGAPVEAAVRAAARAAEEVEEQHDDRPDDAEPAAAEDDGAAHADPAGAAAVLHLRGVEPSSGAEPHEVRPSYRSRTENARTATPLTSTRYTADQARSVPPAPWDPPNGPRVRTKPANPLVSTVKRCNASS